MAEIYLTYEEILQLEQALIELDEQNTTNTLEIHKRDAKTIFLIKQVEEIEEVLADFGEPNCKLVNPYLINNDSSISPWLKSLTNDTEIMMSSDKILTLVDPKPTLLEKYQDNIK